MQTSPLQSQTPSTRLSGVADNSLLEQQVRQLGEWFHNIDLFGIATAPSHFLGDFPNFILLFCLVVICGRRQRKGAYQGEGDYAGY